ncbi:c-type cytochrome biogenesis protein CcmI [Flavimaribacter sediminis]|nr:c-type cytochrome biogenesis protein CcmI [Flavimaribacter sediminis]
MLFWIFAALMTVAVAIVLLAPVMRRETRGVADRDFDAEVYRDQLSEIERDIESGLISAEEAEYARAEVGRRLIKASRGADATRKAGGGAARITGWVVVIALPLIAIGGYLSLGSPGTPALPLSARMQATPENADLAMLIKRAEDYLASNPDDGRGWDVLAPIYLESGRIADAEIAYANAIRLLGSSAQRQVGLGQALFAKSGGIVTAEAQAAFGEVQKFAPGEPFSAYFLALGLAQEGRRQEAAAAFRAMVDNAPADASWLPAVRRQLAELGDGAAPEQTLPGPTREDVAAAEEMTDEERGQMIEGMVASLDARLRDEPDDLQGWKRLIRSYMVLGRPGDAEGALERALAAFDGETDAMRELQEAAIEAGVQPEERVQ